jgi:His/Glu/Gln/Arg/opine family amino acid ABC transporter permease subunit
LPALGSGLIVSLNVALLSLLFASIIGFLVAIAKLSKVKIIRFIATSYTVMVRGVPDLVMMFLIFYGGQIIVNNITLYLGLDYFDIDAFYAGVFTLSFIFGAFMAETFRASILALDKQQLETAYAFGMTKTQVKFRILIPQMLLHALPSFTNNWLVLIKSTAILSIIGLHDMIFVSNLASRSTHQPFIFYFLVSLAYLLITWLSIKSIRKIEDHYNMSHQV